MSNYNDVIFYPEVIKINLSTPFLTKSRCKYCAGLPSHFYYIRGSASWYDPKYIIRNFEWVKKYTKRMCSDHYLISSPKHFTQLSILSYHITKGFKSRLHQVRGANVIDFVEFLMCDCGGTSWAFSDRSVSKRPEITNRKTNRKFNSKFEF